MISDIHVGSLHCLRKRKAIPNIAKLLILSKEQEIAHFSKVIEEKAYINYKGNGEIVYLRESRFRLYEGKSHRFNSILWGNIHLLNIPTKL